MLALLGLVFNLGLTPHWLDKRFISRMADSLGVDTNLSLAVAWQESGGNLNPSLRGHHCWHGVSTAVDGTVIGAVYLADCEVGRYQIKPSTAKARCRGLNIWKYRDNVICGLLILKGNLLKYGVVEAVERYNGSGPLARNYAKSIFQVVGWLTLSVKLQNGDLTYDFH